MRVSKANLTLLVGLVLGAKVVGCSAGSPDAGLRAPSGGAGDNGTGAVFGGSGSGNQNAGGDYVLPSAGSSPNTDSGQGGDNSACGIKQKPEEVIVYSPVAIYVMQDRSTSMNTGLGGGSPQSWGYSTDALQAFVNDQSSSGIDMGLGVFPPMSTGQGACNGSDCGQPVVPIAKLPGNGPPIMSAMQAATPTLLPILLTPTECALRGMINQCLTYMSTSSEKCYAVLVTDGTPTSCDTNNANLVNIVAMGKASGVSTFTLGLTGSDLNFLNQLAQAGGTNAAIDVSGGSAAFIAALNSIRGKVSVGTALPCTWKIPPPTNGQVFDPAKVNVSFTAKGGTAQDFGFVAQADCARASNAWYFDDPNKPTQVLACPTTCDMLKAASGAEVDVSFGCARKPAILH